MGEPVNRVAAVLPLAIVRQRIAGLLLSRRPAADARVGDVSLWPHQRDAVARLRMAIGEFGGALLADDVGTGKTFVALSVASGYAAPLVVAPAGLREAWQRAADRARQTLSFMSFESLSRGRRLITAHDFVIVDEAHHCRNPAARRYTGLAALLVNIPALLLSATPIHNRRDDLVSLLALFLGASAGALDDAAIARCVVRRGRDVLNADRALPRIVGPISLAIGGVDDVTPDAIMALPPPVAAADAGIAGALLAFTLLRQWASSQGALLAAIRRRLAFAHALSATLDDGRYPTRAELSAWTLGDDAQQLAMSALLSPAEQPPVRVDLREAVAAHADGLRVLRRAALASADIDHRRAMCLRDVWSAHSGERSIAFSQFAETIDAYWRELRAVPETCSLTARGARIAGGSISRASALGSFRPERSARAGAADRITALLTTDLASEGIDLHDGSVLIHLDLPWTPARLEQRVGRIVRPGSPHAVAHLYTMEPPLGAAAMLDIRRRLASKLALARTALGAVMPDLGVDLELDPLQLAPTAAAEQLEAMLHRWRDEERSPPNGRERPDAPLVAVIRSAAPGWLALLDAERPRLVALIDGVVSDDPRATVEICRRIDVLPDAAAVSAADENQFVAVAKEQLSSWLDARRGASLAGVGDIAAVRGRRGVLTAIALLSDEPSSVRIARTASAGRALAVAGRPLGAGSERLLLDLNARPARSPAEWLDAVGRLAAPSTAAAVAGEPPTATLLALIVLDPQSR